MACALSFSMLPEKSLLPHDINFCQTEPLPPYPASHSTPQHLFSPLSLEMTGLHMLLSKMGIIVRGGPRPISYSETQMPADAKCVTGTVALLLLACQGYAVVGPPQLPCSIPPNRRVRRRRKPRSLALPELSSALQLSEVPAVAENNRVWTDKVLRLPCVKS